MTKKESFDLNAFCEKAFEVAEKRSENDATILTDTEKMLKHCATEVVEAMGAYQFFLDMFDSTDDWQKIESTKKAFESELADIVTCVLIICAKEKIDIQQALIDCYEKNYKRMKFKESE